MKEKTGYSKKLADPRWQKKRLEILNRDKFTCQYCLSEEKELHVHHLYYLAGKEVFDYPDSALLTLCYECHEYETSYLKFQEEKLIQVMKEAGCQGEQFMQLVMAMDYLKLNSPDKDKAGDNIGKHFFLFHNLLLTVEILCKNPSFHREIDAAHDKYVGTKLIAPDSIKEPMPF